MIWKSVTKALAVKICLKIQLIFPRAIFWLFSWTSFQFSCLSNCGKYLNPSRRLILTTECLNCDGIQPITYNWSAVDVQASVPLSVWPERALTLRNSPYAVILEGTFNSGTSYRIKVVASRPNSGICSSLCIYWCAYVETDARTSIELVL